MRVKALACEFPSVVGAPLSRWSVSELGSYVRASGLTAAISDTTLWRWLHQDAIRPWQHRCWIFPRDPDFEQKAGRILDLYQRIWKGHRLGANEFVICADEKTSIQARSRKYPSWPTQPRRPMRIELQVLQYAGLAILALDCLLIETVQAFRSGHAAKNAKESREVYKAFLTSSPRFRNFFLGNTADEFYRNVRNGLLHDGETQRGWLVKAGRKYELVQRQPNGFVIVNREKFHHALVEEIKSYLKTLSNPLERELRTISTMRMSSSTSR